MKALADEAPVYEKPTARPEWQDALERFDPLARRAPDPTMGLAVPLLTLLASPGIASKEWVYRQYDQQVGTNSLVLPGSDAGVLRIKGTRMAWRSRPIATRGSFTSIRASARRWRSRRPHATSR